MIAAALTPVLPAGHGFAGWARPPGVLAARRAAFPVAVLAAAGIMALLRLARVS